MPGFLGTLSSLDKVFLYCALLGGGFFLVKTIIQFIGIDHGSGADIQSDMGHDFEAHHADSDAGFKVLTIQGVTSFFMMFGLVGLAMHKQSGFGAALAVLIAAAAGSGTVWAMDRLFRFAKRLQSSGTLDLESAIGGEGTVYLTIPADKAGSVLVTYKNRHRELAAVSNDNHEIRTGERIKVVWVKGNTLVVERSETLHKEAALT